MYRLPLADGGFDLVVLQMVLHYAEDPAGVLAEASRMLAPGGRLVVIDLAEHDRTDQLVGLAHRWPGFADSRIHALFGDVGLMLGPAKTVLGAMEVRLWSACLPIAAEPDNRILEIAR